MVNYEIPSFSRQKVVIPSCTFSHSFKTPKYLKLIVLLKSADKAVLIPNTEVDNYQTEVEELFKGEDCDDQEKAGHDAASISDTHGAWPGCLWWLRANRDARTRPHNGSR